MLQVRHTARLCLRRLRLVRTKFGESLCPAVFDDSTGAREWKCANGCTCSASGSADAHFGCGPTAAVDVADAEQLEHSIAATAESDELSDALRVLS